MSEHREANRQATKDAGIYAYSRVAGSLLLFLTLVIGARVYTTLEFAYLTAILLLYETAMALGSLGLADAVFYFIGRDPSGGSHIVRQTSLLLLAIAIPVIGAVSTIGWLTSDAEVDVTPVLPWLAVALLLELPTQPAVNQLIASGHARLASSLYVMLALLRTIAFLVPGVLGWSVETVPVVMAIAATSRLFVHVAIIRVYFPLDPARGSWRQGARLREILWFALPVGVGMIASKLNPQIDKYVVKVMLDTESFANYGAAAHEIPLITLVPYAIAAVMQTRYVRLYVAGEIDALRDLWFHNVRKTALIVIPLAVLLIALGRDVIVLIAGRKFEDAALPFQIFTAVILHRIAGYGAMLQSTGQTRVVLISSFLMVTTNAVLSVPLTYLVGYPGPAIATVLANVPAFVYTLTRIGAALGGGIRGALPWRFYAAVLVVNGVIGTIVWLVVRELALAAGVRVAIGAVVHLGTFVAVGRALRLIDREDLAYLSRWLTLRELRKGP